MHELGKPRDRASGFASWPLDRIRAKRVADRHVEDV